ncbi:uncharacterized protein LOC112564205 isoform X2 [Pomacea canaliculata]|uniref:uncharacterized protein LOC112564205 isoform X2 n=1 Tax=Pomacea canaliculata TaxID=400727 RepID=UPI000D72FB1A|nr:uncharacterized protein LOC112564205 isoform X2 [Pomacea canaliculata]
MAGAGQESGVKHKGNLATLFPKIKICKLRYEFSLKGGHTETDPEYVFVEQLEKENRLKQMKTDLSKTTQLSFSDVDMGIVTAKFKVPTNPKDSKKWMEDVRHVVYTKNKVHSQVFQTGQLSEKIIQELTSTYPEGKASCYLSNDKQSLLVTSSDDDEMQKIKSFVESRIPGTDISQTKQPSAQPVKVSGKKSPVTNKTTISMSSESKEESDERSPVSKTSGDSACSQRKDKADKKSPSMATADMDRSPMAQNEYGTKSPVNKTTGSSCFKSDHEHEKKLPKTEKVALSGSTEVEDMSREKSSDIAPPDILTSSNAEIKSEYKLPVSSQEVSSPSGEVHPSLQPHTQVSVATADGQTSARFDAELDSQGNTLAASASKDVHPVTISDTNRDISSGIAAQASHKRTSAEPFTSGGSLDHTSRQERSLESSFVQSVDKDLKPTVTAPTDAQPPITTKRTIEVPEQFFKLLQGQRVRQDFFSELEKSRVKIDEDSVASGHIVVTHGDREEVIKALQRVIDTLDLADRMKDEDVLQALCSLRKQFPDQVELDKSVITFHRKVEAEVKAAVEIAVSKPVSIPLSLEQMNYIQYHLSSIRQSAGSSDVLLQEGDGMKGVLVISPPPANIRAVKSMVEEMTANIHHKKENMEPSEVLYLSGVKGQIEVKELETKNSCRISVISPGHQVLTRAESTGGCRLLLCEGNMAASDCDVVVFPLTENQKEWPLSQRLILEKGLLASSTEPYKLLCSASTKTSILRVQCQGNGAGQQVVMVSGQHDLTAVGDSTVGDALREVLTSSLGSGASMALPVRQDADVTPAYNLTILLQTIGQLDREAKGREVSNATVVLYLENISDAERREAAKTAENVLKQLRWDVQTDVVAVYGETDKSLPSVTISGLQEDVKKAFSELKSMRVSDKYKVHADTIAADSIMARPQAGKHLTSATEAINKVEENLPAQQKKRIQNTDYLLKLEALQYLLGEDFADITILDREGKSVKIQISSQSDKLMREDMPINDIQWGDVLNAGRKIQSEGIKAFVKPLLFQDKLAIFALDEDAMMKAKRLITFGTEKSRGTSFRSGEAGDQTNSPVKPVAEASCGADFITKSGIRVSVYKTDITKLVVDVIVNAANGRLMHGGGVAAAISRAAGRALDEEGDIFVDRFGQLEVSEVLPTTSGNLPCKTVFHAVGPCWYDYQNKDKCAVDLQRTVFNCLTKAHSLKFTSIAVSSISSAIFGVPEKVCAQMYLRAVQQFEHQYGGKTKLQHIHFVDVRDVMVSVIRDIFTRQWNSDALSPSRAEGHTHNPSRSEHDEATQDPRRKGFSNNQDPGRQKHYEDSQVPSRRDHDDVQDRGKSYKSIQDSGRQEYNNDYQTTSKQESNTGSQEYSRNNMEHNRGNMGYSNQKHKDSHEHGRVMQEGYGRSSQDYGRSSQEHGKSFQEHGGVSQCYRRGSHENRRGFQDEGPYGQESQTDAHESSNWETNTQQSTDPRGSARHDPKGAQDRESGGNDQQIYHQRGQSGSCTQM